jgi:ATP-dependent Lhr-like helicase
VWDVVVTTPLRTGRADPGPLPRSSAASDVRVGEPRRPSATGRAGLEDLPGDSILRGFHPAVASWFLRCFPSGPTEPQRRAWPHIMSGTDVLVASPTGTGKTLTGFLVAIDAAYRARAEATQEPAPRFGPGVVYVSPLRALTVDVHENLQRPLAGIAEEAARLGLAAPDLSVAVRTGDTPAAERAAMRRSPPDLLVTTPESLYLLLTASSKAS